MPIYVQSAGEASPDVGGLADGQLELDGFRFGCWGRDSAYLVAGGDVHIPGEVRSQDEPNPRGSDVWFGRDHDTAGVRELTLSVEDRFDVRPALAALAAAWHPAYLQTPGAYGVLRWRQGDQVYREYGRPRGFEIAPLRVAQLKRRNVLAKFQLRNATAYEDAEQSITLDLVAEAGSTGLLFPAQFPWDFGKATQSQRSSIAYVESPTATPMRIVVRGPQVGTATNLHLWAPGWDIDFGNLALRPGQLLTVDTLDRTALVDGQSVATSLLRGSSLSGLLQPGATEFRFAATDHSATTTASVYWRNTAPIF